MKTNGSKKQENKNEIYEIIKTEVRILAYLMKFTSLGLKCICGSYFYPRDLNNYEWLAFTVLSFWWIIYSLTYGKFSNKDYKIIQWLVEYEWFVSALQLNITKITVAFEQGGFILVAEENIHHGGPWGGQRLLETVY